MRVVYVLLQNLACHTMLYSVLLLVCIVSHLFPAPAGLGLLAVSGPVPSNSAQQADTQLMV